MSLKELFLEAVQTPVPEVMRERRMQDSRNYAIEEDDAFSVGEDVVASPMREGAFSFRIARMFPKTCEMHERVKW